MPPAQALRSSSSPIPAHAPEGANAAAARALVADGDELARNALREALTEAGVCVVGQAADLPQVVNLARRCRPDVVVMDATLSPDGGIDALKAVIAVTPEAQVVLLGPSAEDDAALVALSQGAAGYLSRDTKPRSVARAVQRVLAGEAAISRTMARRLVDRLRRRSSSVGLRPVRSPLTTREWEVLDLMMAGASTSEMAEALVLTSDTVHSHVQHILRKLHAHSRAEAIEIARDECDRLVAQSS